MRAPTPASLRLPLIFLAACTTAAQAAPIDPRVAAQAQARGDSDALLVLADQSDPSLVPLDATANYLVRRRALVDALRSRAERTQRELRAWLDARGIAHRDFWIANVIQARVPQDMLAELAVRNELRRIDANPAVTTDLPQPDNARPATPEATQSVAWGVAKIPAPAVWALGFTGQGVTIAGEDTGYQWDHPALK